MRIMRENANTRVLVVDDEEVVRSSIVEILCPPEARDESQLEDSAALLFGASAPKAPNSGSSVISNKASSASVQFRLDVASSGKEGYSKVVAALEAGDPYAVIFMDMRMPGWDGLRTAEEIRKCDEKVEILFITAFSDHELDEIVYRLGHDIGYFCKPFATEEIRQMALKGIFDWNRLGELEDLLSVVSSLHMNLSQANVLLSGILQQVISWTGGDEAYFVGLSAEGELYDVLEPGNGGFQQLLNSSQFSKDALKKCLQAAPTEDFVREQSLLILPLNRFAILVEISQEVIIPPSRKYLMRLFLKHAAQVLENASLRSEMQLKERLSTLGSGISEVAHDLRNPTMLIRQLLEFAEEDLNDVDKLEKYFDMARKSAERACSYVDDILDFTKSAKLDRQLITLSTVIDELVQQLKVMGDKQGVTIEFEASSVVRLSCDGPKLERSLSNLVQNALEALNHHKVASPKISIAMREDEENVYIEVADNGPGLPESARPLLFEPFCTVGKTQGTGLGLAICKQVVEAHGGSICAPERTNGAAFSISLPKSAAA